MRRFLSSEGFRYLVVGIGILTLLFIGWRFYKDWQVVEEVIQQAQYRFLVLSFVSLQVSLALFTGGWHLLMGKLANARNIWQNSQFYCLANFAKNLPTPIWYIGGRAHFYGRAGYPRSAAVAASFIELALHSLTGLQLLAWLEFLSPGFGIADLLYTLAFLPLIWLFWKPEGLSSVLRWWQRRKGGSVPTANLSRRDLAQLVVIYLLTWVNSIPFFYFIARGWFVTESLPWLSLWKMWLISSLVGYAAAVLLGGFGFLREASLSVLLSSMMPFPVAVVVAASSRLILMVGECFWGLLCVWGSRRMLLKSTREGVVKGWD